MHLRQLRLRPRFHYPHQLVRDPGLSLEEKRELLSQWSSDEHAVESLPTLRHLPGTPFAVTFSSIMDALKELDRVAGCHDDEPPPPPPPGAVARRSPAAKLKAAA